MLEKALKNELEFHLESILNDEYYFNDTELREKVLNLTEEEKEKIVNKTINDEEFTEELFNCFDYYMTH